MNTIPSHHRWPAEGSAQQHWQEKSSLKIRILGSLKEGTFHSSLSQCWFQGRCVYAVNACRSQPMWEQWSTITVTASCVCM